MRLDLLSFSVSQSCSVLQQARIRIWVITLLLQLWLKRLRGASFQCPHIIVGHGLGGAYGGMLSLITSIFSETHASLLDTDMCFLDAAASDEDRVALQSLKFASQNSAGTPPPLYKNAFAQGLMRKSVIVDSCQ